MNLVDDLVAWLGDNPPEEMPYWPHAETTGPFGLRCTVKELAAGASPAHLGVDRSRVGGHFRVPFDSRLAWRLVGGDAGSVLSLNPHDLRMELQVFHTRAETGVMDIELEVMRGQEMPVRPGNLGLSVPVGSGDGTHTHTEVLFPYDDALRDWIEPETWFVRDGEINPAAVIEHCDLYGLEFADVVAGLRIQIADPPAGWGLRELSDRHAVRESIPGYREPAWGHGPTLHVDSKWLLRI